MKEFEIVTEVVLVIIVLRVTCVEGGVWLLGGAGNSLQFLIVAKLAFKLFGYSVYTGALNCISDLETIEIFEALRMTLLGTQSLFWQGYVYAPRGASIALHTVQYFWSVV